MNDDADVYIALRGHGAEVADHPVLQVELGIAFRLVGEHELQVINANKLDVVCVDCMVQGLHDVLEVGRPIEIQEMEWILGELLQ